MAARFTRRLPVLVGAGGLALMAVGFVSALRPSGAAWLHASLGGAGVALVCGLAARGRAATLSLVVPSLVYLVVVLI